MFRWHDMRDARLIAGLILSFLSFMLMITIAAGTPFSKQIYFFNVPQQTLKYGTFGYCLDNDCPKKFGYTAPDGNGEIIKWATEGLVALLIGAVLLDVAFIMLLCSTLKAQRFKWSLNPKYFNYTALAGSFCAILGETFAMIVFITAKHRYSNKGISSSYGAALWIGLAGAILAPIAAVIGRPAKLTRASVDGSEDQYIRAQSNSSTVSMDPLV